MLAPLVQLAARLRSAAAITRRRLRLLLRGAGRQPSHLLRVLRRLRTRVKAREQAHQDKTETGIQ